MSGYYGRKWSVVVGTGESEAGLNVSDRTPNTALRIVFRIDKFALQKAFWGDITIWNLNKESQQQIVIEGTRVIVQAGYDIPGIYGKIFDGQVFQPMIDRENVVDFKTTLHCMDGLGTWTADISNVTLQSGYNYRQMIAAMAANAMKPIPLGTLTENLDQKNAPRGMSIFGDPKEYLRQMAQDNNALFWMGDGQLNVAKLDDEYAQEAIVIGPKTGLIGTPQQWQYGVNFRCLLNPQIAITSPLTVVKIDESIIRQMKVMPGQFLTPLDQDLTFKVVGVSYVGDTRGNDWYVDVTGVNLAGKVSALFGFYSR